MPTYRVLFFGSPDFALPSLISLYENPRLELVAVVSQPDRPSGRRMKHQPTAIKSKAQELGVPVHTPDSVNTPEFLELVKSYGADAGVVVAFGQILSQKLLDLFPQGLVNLHGSLLPRWRGAAPIQRALMEGDKESGVSLQKVVRKLDAGDVLGERRLPLGDEMNAVELYDRLAHLGVELLEGEFLQYLDGALTPQPQDEALVTIAPKIQKSEAEIDWKNSAQALHNKVRGLAMGPQPWTYCGAKKLKLLRTRVVPAGGSGDPGVVLSVGEESFVVQCGQAALEVLEVQPESKAKMTAGEFLRGHRLHPGDRLAQKEDRSP